MDRTGSFIEGVDLARRPDRLYPILSHDWYGFYAGHLPDGRQLLAGVDGDRVAVGFFEPGGEFIDVERRTLPQGEDAEQYLSKEFGYRSSLVRVKRFRIPPEKGQAINPLQLALVGESGFAIAPFPLDWQEFFNDPSSFCEEDRERYTEMIRGWVAREDFALYWGNGSWVSSIANDATTSATTTTWRSAPKFRRCWHPLEPHGVTLLATLLTHDRATNTA